MAEGIRISNAEYRSREGVSSTDLKKMLKSPLHYKYYKENPQEDTPSLLFGRAYHKMCLETSEFDTEFAVAPICDRRTKEGKQIWNDFVAESEGKDIINAEMYEQVHEMRKVLMSTKFVPKLINGTHEMSYFSTDERTGLIVKCRPDSHTKIWDKYLIIDLKTCANADTDSFTRDAIKYGYDIQAAHYCQIMKQCTGHDYEFIFICQEKSAPYAVNVLQASEQFMQSGYETRQSLLETLKECMEKDYYPSYMGLDNEIGSLGLPSWLAKMYPEESEEE